MSKPNYSGIFGGSILSFVEETVGPIQNAGKPYPISAKAQTAVNAYVALERGDPTVKVLFTLGLFAQKRPDESYLMKECFICLPAEWPLPRYVFNSRLRANGLTAAPFFPETLPLDLLGAVTASLQRKSGKFALEEGVFLDKRKGVCAKFDWPEDVAGVTPIDYRWNAGKEKTDKAGEMDDGTVTLLTLAPVSDDKKALSPAWYEARRYGAWRDLRFPLFSDVASVEKMNRALVSGDWKRAEELLDGGVNANRGVYDEDSIWGDLVSYTYLEYAMEKGAFDLTTRLIARGARVPKDAPALVAGNCDRRMFDYLLSLGCDVNAVDNVGYTAMNRAVAFGNQPIIERCKALGGVYLGQAHDTEERLRELRGAGIAVVGAV